MKFLIEAAGIFAAGRPETRVVIFGDGGERAELEKRAARLGLGGKVFFAGWRDDLPALLPSLDVYVQPSLSEGFGWAARQAQAAGLAVVASATGGLGDMIADGETGLLVAPGDSGALAAAVSRLGADPALRGRLGAAAAKAAEAKDFGPAAAAAGIEKIYEEALRA